MPGLQATGTLRYNNYVFDGATHVSVEVEFVRDESQRTVIAQRHIITVDAVVAGSDGTLPDLDTTLENIRRRLGEQGKELVFINKGFGTDLIVNTGLVQDIAFGPKPLTLSWVPLGDDKAAQIVWQVETTVPICAPGKKSRRNGLASINYGAAYAIDARGNTSRTLTGHLTIVNGYGILDTPDRYRTWFSPLPIPGFERSQTWSISADKLRLDFTVTDVEIPSPNPYPKSIVRIEGTHRLSWRMGKDAGMWQNQITAMIEGDANLSPAQCWQVFLTIVEQRRKIAKERSGKTIFLTGVDIEENLFGRPQSMSVQYQILGSLREFVGVSGLWRPLGTNWNQWVVSLAGSVFNNRGAAQLQEVAANDAIVNLCGPPIPVIQNNLHATQRPQSPAFATLVNESPSSQDDDDTDFFIYRSYLKNEQKTPAVQQSPIQKKRKRVNLWNAALDPPPKRVPRFQQGTEFEAPSRTSFITQGSPDTLPGGSGDDVIQISGETSYGVSLEGFGRRAGSPIPMPSVEKVGTRDAIEIRSSFGQRIVCECFGVPVYDAWWKIDYIIDGPPGSVPPTPYFGK